MRVALAPATPGGEATWALLMSMVYGMHVSGLDDGATNLDGV